MEFTTSLVGNLQIEKVHIDPLHPSAVGFLEVPNYFLLFVVLSRAF
jgi:hypothetical protein